MKKLILLLFIPLVSLGQIIVNQKTVEVGKKLYRAADGSIRKQTKTITTKFDITEIKDEFINIYLGNRYHMLSTSKHKNVMISAHWRKRNWNVYDGGELIPMQDEVDVLNYFSKYGFEYFKQNTKTKGGNTFYFPNINYSTTSFTSKSSITLKNNNN